MNNLTVVGTGTKNDPGNPIFNTENQIKVATIKFDKYIFEKMSIIARMAKVTIHHKVINDNGDWIEYKISG